MLLEFRVANCRSFKGEEILSLRASGDTTLEENVEQIGGFRVLRSAAVFGANASGKTNLLRALGAVGELIRFSATAEGLIPLLGFEPFKLCPDDMERPTEVSLSFISDGTRFDYGFSATANSILSEWLCSYPKNYSRLLFSRDWDPERETFEWKFGRSLKGEKWRLVEQTRKDALFLSVAARWNQPYLQPAIEWLHEKLRFLPAGSELVNRPTAQFIHELQAGSIPHPEDLMTLLKMMLRFADPSVSSFRTEKSSDVSAPPLGEGQLLALMLAGNYNEATSLLETDVKRGESVRVYIVHTCPATGQSVELPLEEESAGTQRLFNLAKALIDSAALGFTLVMDEIERSMHPHVVWEVIRFIQRARGKEHCPQLVFSTHDTTILDPELLRRDQIWFAEKRLDGSTEIYPLSDFQRNRARKADSWQKAYLAGKYGAVPVIERFADQ